MHTLYIAHLDPQCFNIVGPICSPSEVGKVELDLIPPVIQSHRHGTYEWLHSCSGLVV